MDIPDGDLVRLARDGDPAAFRLLVERHLPMARARAARLCAQPGGTTPDSIQLSTWEWEGGQDGHQIAAGGHIRCDLAAVPGS